MNLFSEISLFSLFLGIALATSAGFRVFIPLFILSLIGNFTDSLIGINDLFWIKSPIAVVIFGLAMIVEISIYYIPILDNKLDKIKIPFAVLAGVLLMRSTLYGFSPLVSWILAFVLGGGFAFLVSYTIATARSISTVATKGVANFLVNTAEIIGAFCLSITAIILSPLAFLITVILIFLMIKSLNKIKKRPDFNQPTFNVV